MRYWSKGLGRRSTLHIDWSKGATQIMIEDGQKLLASVVPSHLVQGELPSGGAQVVIAGNTLPPIVWRYISVLRKEDFEDIVKLATSQGVAEFLARCPGGRRLFLKLAWFLVVFLFRYPWTWTLWKVLGPRQRLA